MCRTHRKIAMLLLGSLCSSQLYCTHGQLDRETAEKMIRDKKQLPGRPYVLVLHSPAWVESTNSGADAHRQLNLDFLDGLAKAGVIRWLPVVRMRIGFVNGSLVGGTETVRPFAAISQEFVVQHNGGPFEGDWVLITLALPEVRRVTGITQEETTATAEVAVGLKPTPMYNRVKPFVADLLARCRPLPADDPVGINADPLNMRTKLACKSWPSEGRLASSRSFRFRFGKYDDGWRLEAQ